jgi:hypothetical protein
MQLEQGAGGRISCRESCSSAAVTANATVPSYPQSGCSDADAADATVPPHVMVYEHAMPVLDEDGHLMLGPVEIPEGGTVVARHKPS